jgi:hypothetical protein
MSRFSILGYQLLTGISDSSTGAMLMISPAFALRLMRLSTPSDALTYVSFIGAFVLSVGLACLYGALLAYHKGSRTKLEIVWLLTAFTRAGVAIFVMEQVLVNALEAGWSMVAIFDGMCVFIQAIGLRKGWLTSAAR